MVEAQEAEDDVPNEEKSSEEGKVLNLHPHGEKVSQRDCGRLVCNKESGQSKRDSHHRQVKKLGGPEKDSTAEGRDH
jgi:hypothetical protein